MEYDGWIPSHVREYLKDMGYRLPLEDMESHIREWDEWMSATGDFYDYRESDSFGRVYQVHRRSIKPAMRVCREWGSLLLNEQTQVVCEDQKATDWLEEYFANSGFMAAAQATVMRAFGLGTGAFALFFDIGRGKVKVRQFDARMVVPLTWDAEGVTECAFVTRAYYRGKAVDQLQMHVIGASSHGMDEAFPTFTMEDNSVTFPREKAGGTFTFPKQGVGEVACLDEGKSYHVITVSFDEEGNVLEPEGVISDYDTGCPFPTFALVKPAVPNTRVEASPYGQSVFADAVDAIQSVDLAFDALVNEVDVSKMRIFLSDVMFDHDKSDGKRTPIPFGKGDCTIFRKVMSTEDVVQEFAPALRTEAQAETFRIALQMLGDLCGFGLTYYDFDSSGYVKTATEVSSDNSALMRNIRKHENALTGTLTALVHALLWCSRGFGEQIPWEGTVTVQYDDSIITDTAAEKAQDMAEVAAGLKAAWEYRCRWFGEDEATARRLAGELGGAGVERQAASDGARGGAGGPSGRV
jgi:hypothetical protein